MSEQREKIRQFVTNFFKENQVEDTHENRLAAYENVLATVKRVGDESLDSTLVQVDIIGLIMTEKMHISLSGLTTERGA